jgi:hypothetical protein
MKANPITQIKDVYDRVLMSKAEKGAAKGSGGGLTIEQLSEFESVKEGTRQVVKELEEAKARILTLETKKSDGKK